MAELGRLLITRCVRGTFAFHHEAAASAQPISEAALLPPVQLKSVNQHLIICLPTKAASVLCTCCNGDAGPPVMAVLQLYDAESG